MPVVQPPIVLWQVGPHLVGQLPVERSLGHIECPALFDRGGGILDLIDGDQAGNGGSRGNT